MLLEHPPGDRVQLEVAGGIQPAIVITGEGGNLTLGLAQVAPLDVAALQPGAGMPPAQPAVQSPQRGQVGGGGRAAEHGDHVNVAALLVEGAQRQRADQVNACQQAGQAGVEGLRIVLQEGTDGFW